MATLSSRTCAVVVLLVLAFVGHARAGVCERYKVLTEPTGFITDGDGPYGVVMRCEWLLTAPPGERVSIFFEAFVTECSWDFVYVHDGNSTDAPTIAAITGAPKPDPIVSTGNNLTIYFNSDSAVVEDGFIIRYVFSPCALNCSNVGECDASTGVCTCPPGRAGAGCEQLTCSAIGCSNNATCVDDVCQCLPGTHGRQCELATADPAWIDVSSPGTPPLLSAASVYLPDIDIFFAFGGYVHGAPVATVALYDFAEDAWWILEQNGGSPTGAVFEDDPFSVVPWPSARYGASAVAVDGDSVIIFGGRNTTSKLNDAWRFNVTLREWTLLSTAGRPPSPTWGHVAIYAPGHRAMVVHGGHTDANTISSLFFWLNVDTLTWTAKEPDGAVSLALVHSIAVYDEPRDRMLMFGGLWTNSQPRLLTGVVAYSLRSNYYSFLRTGDSSAPRYLHGATLIGDLLIFFSGRGSVSCATHDLVAYNVLCNSYTVPSKTVAVETHLGQYMPRDTPALVNRHNVLYAFGGFTIDADARMVRLHHDTCAWFTTEVTCAAHDDCEWTGATGLCSERNATTSTRGVTTWSNSVVGGGMCNPCPLLPTRVDCQAHSPTCGWCASTGVCMIASSISASCRNDDVCLAVPPPSSHGGTACTACRAASADEADDGGQACTWCRSTQSCTLASNNASCSASPSFSSQCTDACTLHDSCETCTADDGCAWCSGARRCHAAGVMCPGYYGDLVNGTRICPSMCAQHANCNACSAQSSCLWCPSLKECISADMWRMAYPYGQCTGYLEPSAGCIEPGEPTVTPTPSNNCTCNGHSSTCVQVTPTIWRCSDCRDDTMNGALGSCELCRSGFFGAPANGGVCWFILGTGATRGRVDTALAGQYTYARTISNFVSLTIHFSSDNSIARLYISTVSATPRSDNNEFMILGGTGSKPVTLRATENTEWFFSIYSPTTTGFIFSIEDASLINVEGVASNTLGLLFYLIIFFLCFFGLIFVGVLIIKLRQMATLVRQREMMARPRPIDMTRAAPLIRLQMRPWQPSDNSRSNARETAFLSRQVDDNLVALCSFVRMPTSGKEDYPGHVGHATFFVTADGPMFVDPEHIDELASEFAEEPNADTASPNVNNDAPQVPVRDDAPPAGMAAAPTDAADADAADGVHAAAQAQSPLPPEGQQGHGGFIGRMRGLFRR